MAMKKWEYATVPLLVHATKQILDNWGQDGWELVTVLPGPNPENLVTRLAIDVHRAWPPLRAWPPPRAAAACSSGAARRGLCEA
jgi:hypothetical protein